MNYDTLMLRIQRRMTAGPFSSEQTLGHVPPPAKQREVRFSDFESVACLKERGGLGKDTRENWRRLWQENPAMEAAKSQLSMGWVLETARGIVGYQGSVPLIYQYGSRTLVVATGTSLVVEPAYRAQTLALLASFYRQRGVDLTLITTAIPSVSKLSRALHAMPLPHYNAKLFWIFDTREFVKALGAKLGLGGGMAAVGAVLGSSVLRADILLQRRRGTHATSKFRVTNIEVADIGDDFEALWQRKLAEAPRMFVDRSPASLRWHFSFPGSASRATVLRCDRSERLAGYAIIQHTVGRETGLRKSTLADIFVEQDDVTATRALLEAAYSSAAASGDHVFEVWGLPRNMRQMLMSWNPYVRTYQDHPFLFKMADETLRGALADEDAWYASPLDGDTTLMP